MYDLLQELPNDLRHKILDFAHGIFAAAQAWVPIQEKIDIGSWNLSKY